jgi:hypothetical protein
MFTTLLPGSIVYWRLGSFTPPAGWADLFSQLTAEVSGGVGGTILDLRGNASPDDDAGAVRVLHLLVPEDESLAKFATGPADPAGAAPPAPSFRAHGPLIVLIDSRTGGAAEILAASLKTDGALLMGRPTVGAKPVVPDISLNVTDVAEMLALDLIGQGRVLDVIAGTAERQRLNEAALVRGDDPEEDADLATREKKPDAASTPAAVPQDIVLVSALDSLKAIALSQRRTPTPAVR